MTLLRTWDPFGEMARFQDEFRRTLSPEGRRMGFSPAVDIVEDKETVQLAIELPGVKPEDVHVEVNNGLLTVHGERRFEKESTDKNYHRMERSYGSFTRTFALPDSVDSERVDAQLREGVLHVKLAKSEKAKPKKIDVKVSS